MEDTLFACYQDALRTRGQAFTCLCEDKRPKAVGNLVTPIPCEHNKFEEGNQAGGLTIYHGDQFPINKRGEGPNPNQNLNSLARRKESSSPFSDIDCRARDLKAEHWDCSLLPRIVPQLQTDRPTPAPNGKNTRMRGTLSSWAMAMSMPLTTHLQYLNRTRNGAPKRALFGMCLSGAFLEVTASQK